MNDLSKGLSFRGGLSSLAASFHPQRVRDRTMRGDFRYMLFFSRFPMALSGCGANVSLVFRPSKQVFRRLRRRDLYLQVALVVVRFSPVVGLVSKFRHFSSYRRFFVGTGVAIQVAFSAFPIPSRRV